MDETTYMTNSDIKLLILMPIGMPLISLKFMIHKHGWVKRPTVIYLDYKVENRIRCGLDDVHYL